LIYSHQEGTDKQILNEASKVSMTETGYTLRFLLYPVYTDSKMRKRGALNFSPRFAQKHFL